MRRIKRTAEALRDVIFPSVCEVCGKSLVDGEDVMCLDCYAEIPRTRSHSDSFGVVHQRLASTLPIDRAASFFFYYRENPYARLIQKAKYNHLSRYASWLGRQYASEIVPDGFFDGVDMLVPVPLYWWKRFRRGYNQSVEVAKGIAEVTGLPVRDILSARRHSSQTAKSAFERWQNTREVYSFNGCVAEIENRHLLLVDDVITTGATILSCGKAIHDASPTTRLSVISLGITQLR